MQIEKCPVSRAIVENIALIILIALLRQQYIHIYEKMTYPVHQAAFIQVWNKIQSFFVQYPLWKLIQNKISFCDDFLCVSESGSVGYYRNL